MRTSISPFAMLVVSTSPVWADGETIVVRARVEGAQVTQGEVVIDGHVTGETEQSIAVTPGRHTVRVVLPVSYAEETVVVAQGDRAREVVVDLPKGKWIDRWMFGTDWSEGYVTEALLIDLAAAVGSAYVIGQVWGADSATHPYWWGMTFGAIPSCVAAPLLHGAFGRPLPAIISAAGWLSVSVTAFVLGAEVYETSPDAGWTTGLTVAIAGGVLMTTLDMFMARHHRARGLPAAVLPTFTPTTRGVVAGVQIPLR